jgi:protein-disulfide isomerase
MMTSTHRGLEMPIVRCLCGRKPECDSMARLRKFATFGLAMVALSAAAGAKPPRQDAAEGMDADQAAAQPALAAPVADASPDPESDDAYARECGKSPYAIDADSPPLPAPTRIDQPFGNALLGAKDARIRLVVFVDYACEACRIAQTTLDRIVAEEADLAVIYRMIPNDPGGDEPATLSLAIARTRSPAEWSAYHHAIDTGNSVAAEALNTALAAAGVNPKCYFTPGATLFDTAATEEISRNRQFAWQRKLKAFPSWVIGKGPVSTDIEYATLKAAIAKARAASR